MSVLKTLWGLIFDDPRLAVTLIIALIAAGIVSAIGQHLLGAIIIWAGVVVSLWYAVEAQLQLKIRSNKLNR